MVSPLYAFFKYIPLPVIFSFLFRQAVAKTSAAPIERIKLLVQNQDEMVRYFIRLFYSR